MSSTRFRQGGFTLTELLVVIAIISILSSIILPALLGQLENARQAECSSNLRQIGLAAMSYAEDRGFLPFDGDPAEAGPGGEVRDPESCIADLVRYGYLNDPRVLTCPSTHDVAAPPPDDPVDFELEESQCSYAWRRELTAASDLDSLTPIAADRRVGEGGHPNVVMVLFGDGHVEKIHALDLEERDIDGAFVPAIERTE